MTGSVTTATRTSRHSVCAAIGAVLLTLTGCTGADSDPAESPTEPTAHWSDWTPVDASSVLGSNDENVLFSTPTGEPVIHTRSGDPVAELPPVLDATFSPRVLVTAETIIAQLDDPAHTVAAYDWAGEEVWTLDPGTIDECSPGPYFSIRPSASMTQHISAESPVLLTYQEQYEDETIEVEFPDECFGGSRPESDEAAHLVALDPGSGQERWRVSDRVDEQIDGVAVDPTGKFLDRVVSSRGFPALVRTDIATGSSSAASIDSLAVGGDSALGSRYTVDHLGDEIFYVSAYDTEAEPSPFRVTSWRDLDAPTDPDAATTEETEVLDPLPHGTCRMSTWASPSGVVYCLLPPGGGPDWTYSGGFVAAPGTDSITPRTEPSGVRPWTFDAPEELANVPAEDESSLFIGPDPVVPRDDDSPLIVLPSSGNTAVALDLISGDEVWRSPDLGSVDPTTAPYAGQATSVPDIGEVVLAHGDELVGLDAANGSVVWTEAVDGAVQMITHSGGVLAVKDSTGAVRVRVVEPS